MREIIERSKNIFKFWIITSVSPILFVLEIYRQILEKDNKMFGVIMGILFFIFFIPWIIEFVKEIKLFFTIRNKYDLLMYEERGEDDSGDEEEFETLSKLKSTILKIVIFDFLFHPISLFFKFPYKKKIKELENKYLGWGER